MLVAVRKVVGPLRGGGGGGLNPQNKYARNNTFFIKGKKGQQKYEPLRSRKGGGLGTRTLMVLSQKITNLCVSLINYS